MNMIVDTWRQLVRRRLWPVAVLLLAGLVAVPVLLAKEPAPVPPPQPAPEEPTTARELAASGDPIVAVASTEDRARRRRVLGTRKDPFAPAPAPANAASDDAGGTDQDAPSADDGAAGSPKPSGGATAPSTPPSSSYSPPLSGPIPVPQPVPTAPKKTYPVNSLVVRFGDGDNLERKVLERLEPLPSQDEPLLVYLGLTKDRKSAIFMVDAAAEGSGDGRCRPDPSTCETIELRKGETEFFDVTDPETGTVVAQYQLDLLAIKTRKTASASTARKAYAEESKAGRRALQAHVARRGPLRYDYDRSTGTLRRLDREAFTAKIGRAATAQGALAPSS